MKYFQEKLAKVFLDIITKIINQKIQKGRAAFRSLSPDFPESPQ